MPSAAASQLASGAIAVLRWWTLLAPLGMLAALACRAAPAPRVWLAPALTLTAVLPPLLVLLPIAAMSAGWERFVVLTAAAVDAAAVVLALGALRATREAAARAAVAVGLTGSMLGALALLAVISL